MNPSGSSSSSSGDGSGSAESSSPGVFEDWLLTWVYAVVLKGYDRGGDRIEEKIDVSNENNMKTKGSRHTSCYSSFLPSHLRCDVVGEMASGLWEEEKRAAVEKKDPPSLLRVVLKMIRWELLFGTFFGVLQGLFATVARPLLLKYAVEAIVDDDDDGEGGGSRLWYLIIGLGIEQLVEGLCATLSRHALLDHASSTFFATCAYLVHVKSARVSTNGSKMSESALIGNDIIRTKENLKCTFRFFCSLRAPGFLSPCQYFRMLSSASSPLLHSLTRRLLTARFIRSYSRSIIDRYATLAELPFVPHRRCYRPLFRDRLCGIDRT